MKVLDLFSGIGGFSLGLHRAGMQTVAFCEIEPYPQSVLKKNFPGVPIYEDVRTLTAERLRADGISSIDVITGGFPCQDVSVNGHKVGFEGKRTSLYAEILRLLGELMPRYCIMENVTNLLTGGGGEWFGHVLRGLASVGYDAEWHCISASQLGAPHHRDRVWIVAYPAGIRRTPLQIQLDAAEKANPEGELCWEHCRTVHQRNRPIPNSIICGMADGLSSELDCARMKALGNTVIPQIPEILGRAIMAAEGNK